MKDTWRRLGFKPWAEISTEDQEKILQDPDRLACEYSEYWWKRNPSKMAAQDWVAIDPRLDISAGCKF